MKRTLPLFNKGRNVLCVAGLTSAIGALHHPTTAYADEALQVVDAAETASASVTAQQLQELSSAAGQSTSQVVQQIQDALVNQGFAASYLDPSASLLPVLPYALGAGAGLLGIGVCVLVYAFFHRVARGKRRRERSSNVEEAPSTMRADSSDDTAAFVAVLNNEFGQVSHSKYSAPNATYPLDSNDYDSLDFPSTEGSGSVVADGLDDLERFAVCYSDEPFDGSVGGPTAGGQAADLTVQEQADDVADQASAQSFSCPYVVALAELGMACLQQSDQERFAAVEDSRDARDSRSTMGNVAAAYARTDLTQPFNNVLPAQSVDDFAATARLLATGTGKIHRVTRPSSHLDFSGMDVFDTTSSPYRNDPAADPMVEYDDWRGVALSELADEHMPLEPAYGMSTDDYLNLIQTKSQPARAPKRQNFVAPVIGPGVDPAAAVRRQEIMRSSSSPAAAALIDRDNEFIARRSQNSQGQSGNRVSAYDQAFSQRHSRTRTSGSQRSGSYGRPVAPHVDVASGGVPVISRGCVQAGYSDMVNPVSANYPGYVSGGNGGRPRPLPKNSTGGYGGTSQSYGASYVSQPASLQYAAELSNNKLDEFDCQGNAVSSSYIDYIVQDEFLHRHDSPSQRQTDIARAQSAGGSIHPPIPVKDSVKRHRA